MIPHNLLALVQPATIFAIALAVFLVARHLVLGWISRKAGNLPNFGTLLLQALRWPSVLWCLAGALTLCLDYANLSPQYVTMANRLLGTVVIVSLTLAVASVASRAISLLGAKRGMPFAVAGLSQTLTHFFVFSIGLISVLRYLGQPVTPLLTALGVSGIAVALALQDTLSNLFAGIHLLVEEPIHLGDSIRVSTGEEGVVSDIGWRTTRLLTGSNNTIVIPNKTLTGANITNYSMPQRRTAVDVPILASLEADADRIEQIALEEARQNTQVLTDTAPAVVYDPGVLPTHLQLKLVVYVADRNQQGPVQSALRRQLWRRFRAEGIPLPRLEGAQAASHAYRN